MKNYNSNKIDSLVSFTETDLRVDRPYQSENFTSTNLGYQRKGNEDQISTAFNKNDDLETILFKTNVLNDPEVLPTFTKYNDNSYECPNSKAIFSKKIGKVISTVSNTYELVKHDVILDAIQPNLNFLEVEHIIPMNNTARVFIICAIKNSDMEVSSGDAIRRRMIFVNSMDGSYSFKVIQSDVRLWCFNQMGSIQNSKNKMVFKHSKGVNQYLKNLPEFLSYQRQDLANSIEEFKAMRNTPCSSDMLKNLFLHSFQDKLIGQITDKDTKEKRNKEFKDIQKEWTSVKLNFKVEGESNLFNAFNAITEYETHSESSRVDSTESARIRFESLIRGRCADRIQKARKECLRLTTV
jgi:hypothetical protein